MLSLQIQTPFCKKHLYIVFFPEAKYAHLMHWGSGVPAPFTDAPDPSGCSIVACQCLRFQDGLADIIWDLDMPKDSNADDVHAKLLVQAERLSHAQEERFERKRGSHVRFYLRKAHIWTYKVYTGHHSCLVVYICFNTHLQASILFTPL